MIDTTEKLRERCRIDGDHWLWRGAQTGGFPQIWAPDYTNKDGRPNKQHGRRAAWHLKHRVTVPSGWRVYGTCEEKMCVNPAHAVARHPGEQGKRLAATGKLKGQIDRIMAGRAHGRKTSKLTREQIEMVLSSPKSGHQLAKELGINRTTVHRLRTGKAKAFQPVGGIFSGLLRMEAAA